jgi:hypothetical protein
MKGWRTRIGLIFVFMLLCLFSIGGAASTVVENPDMVVRIDSFSSGQRISPGTRCSVVSGGEELNDWGSKNARTGGCDGMEMVNCGGMAQ